MSELAPLALRCRIEDVHPAAEKERKYLKLKLSTSLLHEQFEMFYPTHEKLQPFYDLGCLAQSAKLMGSARVFHIVIHGDDAVVLLELDAYLASCDVGQVEAKHLPCDFLFIVKLGENRDQILMLAKCLKETLPVIFTVAQLELPLEEQTSLAQQVMDKLAAQVEANPNLFGKDTTVTVTRAPRRQFQSDRKDRLPFRVESHGKGQMVNNSDGKSKKKSRRQLKVTHKQVGEHSIAIYTRPKETGAK